MKGLHLLWMFCLLGVASHVWANEPEHGKPKAEEAASEEGEKHKKHAKKEKKPEKAADLLEINSVTSKTCLVTQGVIEDLKRIREGLDAREKKLQKWDQELKDREVALERQMKELKQFRDGVIETMQKSNESREEKLGKLVDMIRTMSPKGASKMLAEMDPPLAISVMERLENTQLAKIMNGMDPKVASQLSAKMTGFDKKGAK